MDVVLSLDIIGTYLIFPDLIQCTHDDLNVSGMAIDMTRGAQKDRSTAWKFRTPSFSFGCVGSTPPSRNNHQMNQFRL